MRWPKRQREPLRGRSPGSASRTRRCRSADRRSSTTRRTPRSCSSSGEAEPTRATRQSARSRRGCRSTRRRARSPERRPIPATSRRRRRRLMTRATRSPEPVVQHRRTDGNSPQLLEQRGLQRPAGSGNISLNASTTNGTGVTVVPIGSLPPGFAILAPAPGQVGRPVERLQRGRLADGAWHLHLHPSGHRFVGQHRRAHVHAAALVAGLLGRTACPTARSRCRTSQQLVRLRQRRWCADMVAHTGLTPAAGSVAVVLGSPERHANPGRQRQFRDQPHEPVRTDRPAHLHGADLRDADHGSGDAAQRGLPPAV